MKISIFESFVGIILKKYQKYFETLKASLTFKLVDQLMVN